MTRIFIILAAVLGLAACAANDLDKPPVPLGDFALGYNVVVAPNPVKGPASREASPDVLAAAVKSAVDARFGRYEGDRLYHLGISVDGYVLAHPGIPIVFTPKSVLIVKVTVWDDARQVKLNDEPHQITVTEPISPRTIVGSGNTQKADAQLANLAASAAKQIERWLVSQNAEAGWFVPDEAG
ncbi:hypothetical protein SAMN05421688_1595 [Poseidonocella pacifica]|uniref:Lipoprotein n=1 Tax=Poseidonocella pacifica TaxID=871651 RepID=A0A1I0WN44_9RHOB|nr:hypothetical protein [Poseidonocella pacifica]SFA90041.1 hypothetical protein SAMN05421688_1595 [Poseidonocella pacifica]